MSTKRARTVEDDSPSGNGGGRHTRHASRACEGCRGRKYRCDGAKPACSNCESRNQAVRRLLHLSRRRCHTRYLIIRVNSVYGASASTSVAHSTKPRPTSSTRP
ncbi:hypothetical protein EXIGLDRAFT_441607 [Exidia glandulosa HHB12029]|uniref:Zn(2)-C6 fungal-type domain-containing protein n=1 Tax=Exidia glandulosa HHB12029 TaxID=1314781 RepID=A0A165KB00_EXIGL|nr:hypothetical protein EXIGLDRAFT_441607 [Exidia glandulosa HHB12029]